MITRAVFVRHLHQAKGKRVFSFLPSTHPAGYGSAVTPLSEPLRTVPETLMIGRDFDRGFSSFAIREVKE